MQSAILWLFDTHVPIPMSILENMQPDKIFPALIGDIGGTNARFQIVRSAQGEVEHFEPVRTSDFDSPKEAIVRSVLAKTSTAPKSAFLAAAGPIDAEGLDLTNCHWNIRPKEVLDDGPLRQLVLLNDFEAQALSLPFLDNNDLSALGSKSSRMVSEGSKVVLGPGTGLGVALLIKAGGRWIPVSGEGGHVDLGPRTDREREIWPHLETVGGRISGEQLLCGEGLVNLYRACCAANGQSADLKTPAEISAAALEGLAEEAEEALSIFCSALGRVAGDLALTTSAKGGVYIAGGIAQKILPFLSKSGFRSAFDDKAPHGNLMQAIQTSVVTHPLPALLGLSAFVCTPEAFMVDIDHRIWTR